MSFLLTRLFLLHTSTNYQPPMMGVRGQNEDGYESHLIVMCILVVANFSPNWCFDHDELTSRLAQEITDNYFSTGEQNNCVTVVTDPGLLQTYSPSNNTVIRIQFGSSDGLCDPSLPTFINSSFRAKCTRYIVQIRRPECFLTAWFKALRSTVFERHTPTVFFLPTGIYKNDRYGDSLLSANETNISADILVAETSGKHGWPVKIYTNNFHQLVHQPGRSPKVFLDEWSPTKGFHYGVNLFPDKMNDLKEKPLRLFAVPYVPYTNDDPLDGSEVRLIYEFCNVHNCKVEGFYNGEGWGEIYEENMTGIGQVGSLYTEEADIGAGANTVWLQFWPYVDFSDVYLGGVLVIVPKPTVLGGWLTPFLPFPLGLWLLVIFSVIVAALGLYLFTILTARAVPNLAKKHTNSSAFRTLTDSLLRTVGMLVSQQPAKMMTGSPLRHLITSMEIIYFVITTCYVAQLFNYLTVPRTNKPIDTMEDIVENGITWLGFGDVWIYALNDTDEPVVKKFVELFKAYPAEQIIKLAEGGGYGIAVERMTGGHFVELPYITETFISKSRVMRGPDLYGMTPITLFLQKGSPYTGSLNRFLGHVQNGGLYYAWEAACARKYLNFTIQESLALSSKKENYPPKILRISDLEGTFCIFLVGLIGSLIVFTIELFSVTKR